jgi:hypothetical protein
VLCNMSSCTSYKSRTIHAIFHFLAMGNGWRFNTNRGRHRISSRNYSFHLRNNSQLKYEDVKVDKTGSMFSACDFKRERQRSVLLCDAANCKSLYRQRYTNAGAARHRVYRAAALTEILGKIKLNI